MNAMPKAGEVSLSPSIKTIGADIYFSGGITQDSMLNLIEQLRQTAESLRSVDREGFAHNKDSIRLYIQSWGGDLLAAFGLIDQMDGLSANVDTVITGCAFSAAALIAMSGRTRYIHPNAFVLIHSLSGGFMGTYPEFQDEMDFLDMVTERIEIFLERKTKLTLKGVRKLMKRNSYFNADQALDLGLVDSILKP
jgi:ATP-dependent protease ClpP protease subunit